ncbi:unnamed protein product [Rhizoctonia solani]|uniref:Uncharacterized protein n=1 Tax=Rhizoctonia solani TaxID=456999 RepID=A0A8H3DSJ8_9AGAM|nr:unnamed protein product [Rhizoctonia solani]
MNRCGSEGFIQVPTHADKNNGLGGAQQRKQLPTDGISQPLVVPPYGFSEAPFYAPTGYITSVDDLSDPSPATSPCLSLAAINNPPWDLSSVSSSGSPPESEEDHPNPSHVSNRHNLNFLIGARTAQTLSILPPNTGQLINYVLDQYERILDSVYFKPKGRQVARMRELVVSRLQASSITRCAIILMVKMVESMLNGESQNYRAAFKQSVERFESQLMRVKDQHPNPVEVQYLLNGFLELAFLKMRVSNGYRAYQLLQNAAPTFLDIVYSDPNLWPNPNGPPMVCMSKVASSTRFELGHFALMDMICAMAYGLPQVVDYETATPSPDPDVHPIEWVHCCPLEFQLCIAEMNRCCSRSYVASDWQAIERRLLSYKAVCGVSSDDPRVQSAVRQTFQLFKTVKREDPPKVNVHFMVQYLIVSPYDISKVYTGS